MGARAGCHGSLPCPYIPEARAVDTHWDVQVQPGTRGGRGPTREAAPSTFRSR